MTPSFPLRNVLYATSAVVFAALAWLGAQQPKPPREADPTPPTIVPLAAPVSVEPVAPSLVALWNANQELLNLHNRMRRKGARPSLTLNLSLVRAAARHARDLAAHDTLTHDGFDGADLLERIRRAGYSPLRAAENAAVQWPLPSPWPDPRTPDWTVDGWMNSPAHRSNLLGPYTEFGAGYADTPRGKRYWVAVYAAKSASAVTSRAATD